MDTGAIMMKVAKYIPKDILSQNVLRDKLDKLDDKGRGEVSKKIDALIEANKDGILSIGFVVAMEVLFGWLGSSRYGILKQRNFIAYLRIILFVLLFVWVFISHVAEDLTGDAFMVDLMDTIGGFVLLVLVIFWVADWFLIGRSVRRYNLNKILSLME